MKFTKVRLTIISALVCSALAAVPVSASGPNPMPSWMNNAVIYEVNVRQFSDDSSFASLQAQLPRLHDLGVNVLWLMPIHPISQAGRLGSLGSYYAVKDYKAVNPEFGTSQDFANFMSAAHDLDFKVVLDWVANHTGRDNVWITAENHDWFNWENGELVGPNGWNDVADLNFDNADMRAAMIDAMKYWVTEYGVDGFRCDYAAGVPDDFWQDAIAQLNQIKPVFMLAENEDAAQLSNAFDANYGWTFKDKFNSIASNRTGFAGLDWLVTQRIANNPSGTTQLMFITNHDENSWNGTEYERLGSLVKMMTVLYFTLPGVPLVYTGQEISMNHALAFFDKDPVDWNAGKDNVLLRKMIALKRTSSALNAGSDAGSYERIATGNSQVYAFARQSSSGPANRVVVIANSSALAQTVVIPMGSKAASYREVLTNTLIAIPSSYRITIPANGYRVFTSDLVGGTTVPVTGMKLSKSSIVLKVGAKARISASLTPGFPSNATVTWSSSNPKIATVSSTGLITAKKRGAVTVVAKSSNRRVKASVRVTVR